MWKDIFGVSHEEESDYRTRYGLGEEKKSSKAYPPPTIPFKSIYAFLLSHEGCSGLNDLAKAFQKSPRKIRKLIQEEINNGALIGSRSDQGGGYFAITTEEQLGVATAELRSRARELFARADALEKNWRKNNYPDDNNPKLFVSSFFPRTNLVDYVKKILGAKNA